MKKLDKLKLLVLAGLLLITGCYGKVQTGGSQKGKEVASSETVPTLAQPVHEVKGDYVTVNGLKMYYALQGTGRPLVLLHGAFGMATIYPELATGRQVIAVELQGHGHTADIDRPLSFEQMADDVAELLKTLKIERTDVFGYSLGGSVGLALAIRHPDLVGKLAINGSTWGPISDAYEPDHLQQFLRIPADFAPPILKAPYDKVAPDPKQWPAVVAKIKTLGAEFKGFSKDDLKSLKAQVLITQGDRDGVRPEHSVELFRMIPNAQLAFFPGGDHFLIFQQPNTLLPTVATFLNSSRPIGPPMHNPMPMPTPKSE